MISRQDRSDRTNEEEDCILPFSPSTGPRRIFASNTGYILALVMGLWIAGAAGSTGKTPSSNEVNGLHALISQEIPGAHDPERHVDPKAVYTQDDCIRAALSSNPELADFEALTAAALSAVDSAQAQISWAPQFAVEAGQVSTPHDLGVWGSVDCSAPILEGVHSHLRVQSAQADFQQTEIQQEVKKHEWRYLASALFLEIDKHRTGRILLKRKIQLLQILQAHQAQLAREELRTREDQIAVSRSLHQTEKALSQAETALQALLSKLGCLTGLPLESADQLDGPPPAPFRTKAGVEQQKQALMDQHPSLLLLEAQKRAQHIRVEQMQRKSPLQTRLFASYTHDARFPDDENQFLAGMRMEWMPLERKAHRLAIQREQSLERALEHRQTATLLNLQAEADRAFASLQAARMQHRLKEKAMILEKDYLLGKERQYKAGSLSLHDFSADALSWIDQQLELNETTFALHRAGVEMDRILGASKAQTQPEEDHADNL
ncbi:MAG: TolC family protein [Lentisphaerota bacterium]